MSRSRSAIAAGPNRRAKPARGRRCAAPSVRTPIDSRRARAAGGQPSTAIGSGANAPTSRSRASTATLRPARDNASAASGVGASDHRGASPASRQRANTCAQSARAPPNNRKLPRTSSNTASGSRLTRGLKPMASCARRSRSATATPCNASQDSGAVSNNDSSGGGKSGGGAPGGDGPRTPGTPTGSANGCAVPSAVPRAVNARRVDATRSRRAMCGLLTHVIAA